MTDADETPLSGGNSGDVVRVSDTVRRTAALWTPSVHALLDAYGRVGIEGVPRPLGTDEDGREVLAFLPGALAEAAPDAWAPAVLDDLGALLGRLHEASVGLAGHPGPWRLAAHEPAEVVCHNDVAPYNVLLGADGRFAGLIDFDAASPGPRAWDLAYAVYRFAPFVEDAPPAAPTDPAERRARGQRLLDAYGGGIRLVELAATLVVRLDELAEWTDRHAATTGRSELHAHAAMYRRDRDRIAQNGFGDGFGAAGREPVAD
ncbi:phosphotransferase [Agromyces seonyuensis]|uniref:Phosphotransferase n=1 Tax=Agromyces seonyuensis TaxID=2662446 RepID=A0A6I4NXJ1_9MICO|nr:phosphotransferase [Agromyces seonyuensis]MWB97852.1 phosphotransferase [Agromyces seonyuensis]